MLSWHRAFLCMINLFKKLCRLYLWGETGMMILSLAHKNDNHLMSEVGEYIMRSSLYIKASTSKSEYQSLGMRTGWCYYAWYEEGNLVRSKEGGSKFFPLLPKFLCPRLIHASVERESKHAWCLCFTLPLKNSPSMYDGQVEDLLNHGKRVRVCKMANFYQC